MALPHRLVREGAQQVTSAATRLAEGQDVLAPRGELPIQEPVRLRGHLPLPFPKLLQVLLVAEALTAGRFSRLLAA